MTENKPKSPEEILAEAAEEYFEANFVDNGGDNGAFRPFIENSFLAGAIYVVKQKDEKTRELTEAAQDVIGAELKLMGSLECGTDLMSQAIRNLKQILQKHRGEKQ